MNRHDLIFLTQKALLVWLVLSSLLWYFGEWLGTSLLPLVEDVIRVMAPEFSPNLKLVKVIQPQSYYSVELSILALQPIYLNASLFIPTGTELKSSTPLLHVLVPFVIEWSILLVWPLQRWSQRLLLVASGGITAILIVLATLPALLLGQMEIAFQEVALTDHDPRPVPWFLDWMVFCELGGGWLLAITASWLCIQWQRGFVTSIH
jgi:hypothetical protein